MNANKQPLVYTNLLQWLVPTKVLFVAESYGYHHLESELLVRPLQPFFPIKDDGSRWSVIERSDPVIWPATRGFECLVDDESEHVFNIRSKRRRVNSTYVVLIDMLPHRSDPSKPAAFELYMRDYQADNLCPSRGPVMISIQRDV